MRIRHWPALVLAGLLALSPALAAAQEPEPGTEAYNRNAGINMQIRNQLQSLPHAGVFDWFEWTYHEGKVSLNGAVWRPITRDDAERAVKRVQGVDEVVNNIEVLPTSPHDDRLRRQLFRAVYGRTGLERYAFRANPPIHIIVKNGRVRLEGAVANELERTMVFAEARSVPGVFEVTNNLRVDSDPS